MKLGRRVEAFLDEDRAWDDVSSRVAEGEQARGVAVARDGGVAAGLEPAAAVFEATEPPAEFEERVDDGDEIEEGDELFAVEGDAASLLRGERLALNLVASMSGIATVTRRCVEMVENVTVAATRKTTPGYRYFEKRAVELGGGDPHRFDLSDAVMLKDNHLDLLGLEAAVERARSEASFTAVLEVEAEDAETALRAAKLGVDVVMLDNASPAEVREIAPRLQDHGVTVEVSGGVTQENLRDYDVESVDVVSMGGLVHSSDWLDVSMSFE